MYYIAVQNDTRILAGPFRTWEKAWDVMEIQYSGRAVEVVLMDESESDSPENREYAIQYAHACGYRD